MGARYVRHASGRGFPLSRTVLGRRGMRSKETNILGVSLLWRRGGSDAVDQERAGLLASAAAS
jgi:hypothetical protein